MLVNRNRIARGGMPLCQGGGQEGCHGRCDATSPPPVPPPYLHRAHGHPARGAPLAAESDRHSGLPVPMLPLTHGRHAPPTTRRAWRACLRAHRPVLRTGIRPAAGSCGTARRPASRRALVVRQDRTRVWATGDDRRTREANRIFERHKGANVTTSTPRSYPPSTGWQGASMHSMGRGNAKGKAEHAS